MSTDKILQRIQLQIDELTPILELFVDNNIQPSTQDCENFQKYLSNLQESVAIYKYNKQGKELSPSFNLHARLSEKETQEEKKAEIVKEIKETVKLEREEKIGVKHHESEGKTAEVKKEAPEPIKSAGPIPEPRVENIIQPQKTEVPVAESLKAKSPLAIGLNDKFRFINELFSQNSAEYNIALEQINTVSNWNEAEIYLNSLKNVYGWKEQDDVIKYFFAIVKKRFE